MNIIEKLNKLMGEENTSGLTKEEIKKRINEPASLEISKKGNCARIRVRGNAFNTLLLLAKLENAIFNKTGCSKKEFETFRMMSEILDDND